MDDEISKVLHEILTVDLEMPESSLQPEADLIADLGFDSLAFAIGVSELDARLGIQLTKDDVYGCRTLGELEDVVRAKKPERIEP